MCAHPNNFAQPTAARALKHRNRSKTSESAKVIRGGRCCSAIKNLRQTDERQTAHQNFGARRAPATGISENFATQTDALHAHSPSLRFNTSLTACGLALPPDALIAWPTNHPIAFGLVLASATLSGFLAMMSSMTFSIAPMSVTCFIEASDDIG